MISKWLNERTWNGFLSFFFSLFLSVFLCFFLSFFAVLAWPDWGAVSTRNNRVLNGPHPSLDTLLKKIKISIISDHVFHSSNMWATQKNKKTKNFACSFLAKKHFLYFCHFKAIDYFGLATVSYGHGRFRFNTLAGMHSN